MMKQVIIFMKKRNDINFMINVNIKGELYGCSSAKSRIEGYKRSK